MQLPSYYLIELCGKQIGSNIEDNEATRQSVNQATSGQRATGQGQQGNQEKARRINSPLPLDRRCTKFTCVDYVSNGIYVQPISRLSLFQSERFANGTYVGSPCDRFRFFEAAPCIRFRIKCGRAMQTSPGNRCILRSWQTRGGGEGYRIKA